MIFDTPPAPTDPLRADISALYRADETETVDRLLDEARLPQDALERIAERSRSLVTEVRRHRIGKGGLDAFLHEYELSSQEGVVLMCLAEALLRIPDADTADRLIRDKLGDADWEGHLGHSESLFVNASTWALMLTGRVVSLQEYRGERLGSVLGRMVGRLGEPVIRQSVVQGMRIMARQFVMGRTIGEALDRARDDVTDGYRHSFDMLGEAARTMADADAYFDAYRDAIAAVGKSAEGGDSVANPGISVKLSGLHPRYEIGQRDRVMSELADRIVALGAAARDAGIGMTIDAEEADRLDVSFDLLEHVSGHPALSGWDGLGLALQAYQKRARPAVDWLADLARRHHRRLMLRLVKGAYWDTEIKVAQVLGLDGYPVFTRKISTDVSFLACARRIFEHGDAFYPQFATHNAHTLAAIVEMAPDAAPFEFQRLHGMGEALYDQVVGPDRMGIPCRIYAPVGSHEALLAYLVRRLLENGANSSFVNRIVDERLPIDEIIADPVLACRRLGAKPHPSIPLPADMFGSERVNAAGLDLSDPAVLEPLAREMEHAAAQSWTAAPIVGGVAAAGDGRETPVADPADRRRTVGHVVEATPEDVERTMARASRASPRWSASPADERASCLERYADLMERDQARLMAMAVREAGKTLPDAVAEIREAVDFCRYYAARCREDFADALEMAGPTGEENRLGLHGRGVFVCISPWNFPLAIFTGQVTAALAAGNAVVAKPAEQTALIAAAAVSLLHEAGVPPDVLHLLPGDGRRVGAPLVEHPLVAGVAFTGSTETARAIQLALAAKEGPIVPLIAETGGQNAMIVDSSALLEQVVTDVIVSAFQSAGQRCSALRVLFVQEDIAEPLVEMLRGAMAELRVGDPAMLSTDVGPVIDDAARDVLEAHVERMEREARVVYRCAVPDDAGSGSFVAPTLVEIAGIGVLEREVFGPVLHVVRFAARDLDRIIDDVNATGYGLTVGIHSRIDATIERALSRLRVGNAYVNRNQIGAVVGVQPFGGEGLSGTGPKAGGPRYLHRFATERSVSVNTTAQGGNTSLMTLQD